MLAPRSSFAPRAAPLRASRSPGRPLPAIKTLEEFDFEFQPSLDAKLVRKLATGRFIAGAENGSRIVPLGVGKTHLAIALGRAAVEAGHSTCSSPPLRCSPRSPEPSRKEKGSPTRSPSTPTKALVVDELRHLPSRNRSRTCSSSSSADATSGAVFC